jgi:hypothetical protein
MAGYLSSRDVTTSLGRITLLPLQALSRSIFLRFVIDHPEQPFCSPIDETFSFRIVQNISHTTAMPAAAIARLSNIVRPRCRNLL